MKACRELVIATTNLKKKRELVSLLKGTGYSILTLADFDNLPAVKEDCPTFEGNAIKKALSVSRFVKRLTLAEDSGLEVEALGGLPGIRSARFAGPAKNDRANIVKLLKALDGVPPARRKARFICCAALADNGTLVKVARGSVSGLVSERPKGKGGFGYDPVFFYPPLKKNFAELPAPQKNKISHRHRALAKIKRILQADF